MSAVQHPLINPITVIDDCILRCGFVGGCGVVWNDDIDIAAYEIWKNGV